MEIVLSHFWKSEVQNRGICGLVVALKALEENLCLSLIVLMKIFDLKNTIMNLRKFLDGLNSKPQLSKGSLILKLGQ
jgi:hypothetical protein